MGMSSPWATRRSWSEADSHPAVTSNTAMGVVAVLVVSAGGQPCTCVCSRAAAVAMHVSACAKCIIVCSVPLQASFVDAQRAVTSCVRASARDCACASLLNLSFMSTSVTYMSQCHTVRCHTLVAHRWLREPRDLPRVLMSLSCRARVGADDPVPTIVTPRRTPPAAAEPGLSDPG